jgi:hypothetical protein
LLLKPLITGRHFATIHHPWLSNKVPTRHRLLPVRRCSILRPLNRSTRFRHARFSIKSYSLRFIPPNRNAVTIPVLKNVVSLKKFEVPFIPPLMRRIVKDDRARRLPGKTRRFKNCRKPAVVFPS